MRHPTTPQELYISQQIAFNKARLAQYMERTGQTYDQVVAKIMNVYSAQGQQAVNALVDPVVDPEWRSEAWEAQKQAHLTYLNETRHGI